MSTIPVATQDDGIGAPRIITVFVPGQPAPQGSKRFMGMRGGKGVLLESSKKVKPWRADVKAAFLDGGNNPLIRFEEEALHVRLEFVLNRPASTSKRATPPAIKRPDLDKLIRAVLDALSSAGVWRDDSQVVSTLAEKRLAEIGEPTGCRIKVCEKVW